MSTNYPGTLDTLGAGGTIGGPFVDAAPPTDLFVDVAAQFRTNLNDAMLAVQTRVGLTNDTNPASLSWATISAGGVGNLGLRFAQDQSQWPGAVGESGIFLKDGTFEPMFHRAGEPVTTFYSMLGGGGGGTLQDAYNTSLSPAIIATTGTKHLEFQTHSSGALFAVSDEGGSNYFISADEVAGELTLGATSTLKLIVDGHVASDINFDGTTRSLINTNANLYLQTLGTGNVGVGSAGDFGVSAPAGIYITGSPSKVELRGSDMDFLADTGDIYLHAPLGFVEFQTVGGETMQLLTDSDDPTVVAKDANRGSMYLRDSGVVGELYIKQDDGSTTNWTLLGGGTGAATLQDGYNNSASPAVIAMTGTKHLNFRTAAAGASFIVSDQADANFFINADESSGVLSLGAGSLYKLNFVGQVSSDITFDSTAHQIVNDNATLSLRTTTAGNVNVDSAGKVDITGASGTDVVATTGNILLNTLAGVIDVETSSGERMQLITGSDDPTSVSKDADRGSLYLRDTGAVGELYVKQDNGNTTNWTLLSAGAGTVTLQDAYNNGNTITTSGGNSIDISGTEDFNFYPNATTKMEVNSLATPSTSLNGIFYVSKNVGALDAPAAKIFAGNLIGNNVPFGGVFSEVQNASDLSNSEVMYAYRADLTMTGNGPVGAPVAFGAAYWAANSSFTGANQYVTAGMYVDPSFNYTFYSDTGNAILVHNTATETFDITPDTALSSAGGTQNSMLRINQTAQRLNAKAVEVQGQLGPTNAGGLGTGGHNYYSEYTAGAFPQALISGADYYLYRAQGDTHVDDAADAWEYGYFADFTIPSSGGGAIADVGLSIIGHYANVPETYDAGGIYHNNDGFYTWARWAFYAEQGESKFRRTEFEGPTTLGKPLVKFRQAAQTEAFHHLHGGHNSDAVTPLGNLCTTNAGTNVVGPLDSSWLYIGMYQVYVTDSNGVIPTGHYWVPLYQAI